MKFGIDSRKKLSGASLYIYIFQACSLMPLLYIIVASGYLGLTGKNNILAYLFDFGMSAIPRLEALGLSLIYRKALNEILVYFLLAGIAFTFGIIADKLLKNGEKTAVRLRIVFIVLIATDLVIRLLPFSFSTGFGLVPAIVGFAIRLACLILIIADLIAYKKENEKAVTD